MMGGQKQSIGDNSTAIQADGDITINQGLSPTQMYQIMKELREIVDDFTAEAASKADERFREFQDEMLKKFQDDKIANSNAFKDPDFQFILKEAQIHYARSDNEATNKLLIELLAKRSNSPHRDRMALILNEATSKVSKLTDEDVSVLSLTFLLMNTSLGSANREKLINIFNELLTPIIKTLKTETSCYLYLESIGCISLNSFRSIDLIDVFDDTYKQYWTEGFTLNELKQTIFDQNGKLEKLKNLLIPIESMLHDQHGNYSIDTINTKLIFRIKKGDDLKAIFNSIDISDEECDAIFSLIQEKEWNKEKLSLYLKKNIEKFSDLIDMWDKISIQNTSLTSVGIAIAHAHINNIWPEFRAPLNVWIK